MITYFSNEVIKSLCTLIYTKHRKMHDFRFVQAFQNTFALFPRPGIPSNNQVPKHIRTSKMLPCRQTLAQHYQ
jgi:hypothetical protein